MQIYALQFRKAKDPRGGSGSYTIDTDTNQKNRESRDELSLNQPSDLSPNTTQGSKIENSQPQMPQQRRRYPNLKEQEQMIYRRLLIIGIVLVFIIVVFFFWGVPIFVRIAEFLSILRGESSSSSPNDVIPPFTPRVESIPTATNSANLSIRGSAEAGSTVEIFLNGELKKKLLVGQNARFSIEDFTLSEGENRIEVRSIDQAGNTSSLSPPSIVTFDDEPPLLEVREPKSGTAFFGGNRDIKVTGTTEVGGTVTVNGFLAIVDSEGKFSYTYALSPGENTLNISAKDAAGNTKEEKVKVTYNP